MPLAWRPKRVHLYTRLKDSMRCLLWLGAIHVSVISLHDIVVHVA
jgi:hypothetical protein